MTSSFSMLPRASERLSRGGLRPLVDELVRRYGEGVTPTTVVLRGLTDQQRHAIADLLGSARLEGEPVRLRVARLAEVLGLTDPGELREVVIDLRGSIGDRRSERRAVAAEREALWDWLEAEARSLPIASGHEASIAGWARWVRQRGVRGGMMVTRRHCEGALAVLRTLPADGRSLAALAGDVFGDPHALDAGRSVAAFVQDALARLYEVPRPRDAEGARSLWELANVVPDELSSTVTVLGLRPHGSGAVADGLRLMAEHGEPVVLTLSQLRRWPLEPLPATACAYVVENPSLLGQAAALAWDGPPIICTSGRPTVAVVTLLRQLGGRSASLHQHADFDPVGLAVTTWLAERAGTKPWMMGVAEYRQALSARRDGRVPIEGPLPPTPWDPELHDAIATERVAVYEEDVRTALLGAMKTGLEQGR